MKNTNKKQPKGEPPKTVSDCGGIKSGILSPKEIGTKKQNQK